MILELQVYGFVGFFALTLFVLERIFPAVPQEQSEWWFARAMLLFGLTLVIGKIGDMTWMPVLREHSGLQLFGEISAPLQGLLCFLIGSFFFIGGTVGVMK